MSAPLSVPTEPADVCGRPTEPASRATSADRLRNELLAAERHTWPRLSPDGRSVMFVRTVDEGQELWLRADDGGERRVAVHHGESLGDLAWTRDSSALLYRHTPRGRERWRLSAVQLADLSCRTLPTEGPVSEYWLGPAGSTTVVYAVRNPHTGVPELYEAEPAAAPRLLAADRTHHRWLVDRDLRPRGGIRLLPDGSVQVVAGADLATARPLLTVEADAASDLSTQGFSSDGSTLYVLTSSGAPTRRLLAIDVRSGRAVTAFAHDRLDVESYPIAGQGVWFDPASGRPDLCSVMDQRITYQPLTDRLNAAIGRLTTGDAGAVPIDRSTDDRTWLTVHIRTDGPITYRLFRPDTGDSTPLFHNRPGLAGFRLPDLEDFQFTASDGLPLSGYLMRPLGDGPPPPVVVVVHGGPAGRDYWRFHAEAQFLASLGCASLHINYRGSRGFGGSFRLAGNGEWGRRMQQDLYEAVDAAAAARLIDPGRVAFLGGSYGGYAALLGACIRPDLVRCAIAISPPCDLVTLAGAPPAYWQPLAVLLRRQVLGDDAEHPLDEEALALRSPLHALTPACAPLLIAHGVRDPRVPVADVDRFVARAEANGTVVRYLRFPDEGHHVASNANRHALFRAISAFLEDHLVASDLTDRAPTDRASADTAPLHPQ
ncbi:alpha/beta fold hydrolase [Streptomyces sp. NPDC088847]|uniref:S9 family peptidase n=1 Tax=Streptomyces sp. NPDC088847 TaxID=3365909 RepID=UPI00381E2615